MTEIYLVAAVVLALAGIAAGILAVLALAIHREDKDYSLITDPRPGRLAGGARAITSAYAHWPDLPRQAGYPEQELVLSGRGQSPR